MNARRRRPEKTGSALSFVGVIVVAVILVAFWAGLAYGVAKLVG